MDEIRERLFIRVLDFDDDSVKIVAILFIFSEEIFKDGTEEA